jgi:hypothetical protein
MDRLSFLEQQIQAYLNTVDDYIDEAMKIATGKSKKRRWNWKNAKDDGYLRDDFFIEELDDTDFINHNRIEHAYEQN